MSKHDHSKYTSIIRGERGAVTIYTILVIVPIFIFQAVLIDFVRVKVASMEAEQATRAATRSVLSAYDKKLLDYGLFGLKANAEERTTIANRVISLYGTDGTKSDTFRWVVMDSKEELTSVVPMYSLADHRLMIQQILEDMKYKAPIEFTRNLYDKWKGKKELVNHSEEEVKQAEELDALLKQREKQLVRAFDHVKQINDQIEEIYISYQSIQSDEYEDEDEVEDAYEDLLTTVRNDFLELQQQAQAMNEYIVQSEQIEHSMLQQWDQEVNGKLNDAYILGHEFYLNYKIGISTPLSSYGAFMNKLAYTQAQDFHMVDIEQFYASFQSWFTFRSNEEHRRIAVYDNLEQKKKEQRKGIDSQMNQTKQAINAQVCSNANEEQYDRLKSYYHKYLSFNSNLTEQDNNPIDSQDLSSDHYQTNSISFLSNLANVMESIRDEAYVNEYSMYYFNHRTSSMSGFTSPLQEQLNTHTLQGQEVEYILYGLNSCTANRMAAYSEIYMLRFAIRMIESLTDARKAAVGYGSPLLMVLIAAAEAGVKAYRDMERITNGEELPVFAKWGALTMNYADYLRMFLTVHSKEVRKLSRMQALIQLNTQIDLQLRPVYIEINSVMTMRLWFIRGGQYQIKKTAAMSY